MESKINKINEKYPPIQEFGCAAHGLNLFIEGLYKIKIKEIVDKCQLIVKEVSDLNMRTAPFDEISKKKVEN